MPHKTESLILNYAGGIEAYLDASNMVINVQVVKPGERSNEEFLLRFEKTREVVLWVAG